MAAEDDVPKIKSIQGKLKVEYTFNPEKQAVVSWVDYKEDIGSYLREWLVEFSIRDDPVTWMIVHGDDDEAKALKRLKKYNHDVV